MGFETRIMSRHERKRALESLISGASSINIDQSMRLSKRRILKGSIGADWRMVGKDISAAIESAKSEKEAA